VRDWPPRRADGRRESTARIDELKDQTRWLATGGCPPWDTYPEITEIRRAPLRL